MKELKEEGKRKGKRNWWKMEKLFFIWSQASLTFPTSSVYRVGVSSFTKLYSDRYGPVNIRMNCLLPGFTDSLDLPQKFAEMSSLKRLARADEQAKVAAFLLSDDSSYITGQSLRVDGGVTRHMWENSFLLLSNYPNWPSEMVLARLKYRFLRRYLARTYWHERNRLNSNIQLYLTCTLLF